MRVQKLVLALLGLLGLGSLAAGPVLAQVSGGDEESCSRGFLIVSDDEVDDRREDDGFDSSSESDGANVEGQQIGEERQDRSVVCVDDLSEEELADQQDGGQSDDEGDDGLLGLGLLGGDDSDSDSSSDGDSGSGSEGTQIFQSVEDAEASLRSVGS